MPIVSRVAAMTSKAWGQFKSGLSSLAGNYLYTWGSNTASQTGNGLVTTLVTRSSPVQVAIRKTVSKISSAGHTQIITSGGALWAWGNGTLGRLGDGTTVSKSSPVQIGTLTNWAEVSTGTAANTGAIKTDGTLWTWGLGIGGALGDGTTVNKSSPVQIGTLTNWSKIAYRTSGASALKTDGTLWSWGAGSNGALGDGTTVAKSSPVQIGTLTTWASVSSTLTTTFAIKTDGTLWGWGNNTFYILGDGTTTNRSSPIQIGTGTDWSKVFAGGNGVGAIKTDGTLWAWGTPGTIVAGPFGGTDLIGTASVSSPVQIPLNWNALPQGSMASGSLNAIQTNGYLWGWGYNRYGQVGNGSTNNTSYAIQIGTLTNWSSVTNGEEFSLAIKTDGTLWAWGVNNEGELGQGDTIARSSPVQVGTLSNWAVVSGGRQTVAAVKTDGTLWTWGSNAYGQLGNGATIYQSSPIQVGTLTNWSKVYSGDDYVLAVKTDGTLWAWGLNTAGELGDGTTVNKSSPVQIGALTNWSSAVASTNHSTAIKNDGTIWAWGSNSNGQLGDGTTSNKSSPIQIGTLTTWSKVTAGNTCSLAVKADGTLWAWGLNNFGQLGTNNTTNYSSPVQVGTLTNWTDVISTGAAASFALNSEKIIYGFGKNTTPDSLNNSALGSNFPLISRPTQIGTLTTWTNIALDRGANYSWYGTTSDGILWSCGENTQGQLMQGSTLAISRFTQVAPATNWSFVSAGETTSSAINPTGLFVAGNSTNGALGQTGATFFSTPQSIGSSDKKYAKAVLGNSFAMAIDTSRNLYTWGSNALSALGTGDTFDRSLPTQIGTQTYNAIGQQSNQAIAVRTNGTLWNWGFGTDGALALGENPTTSPLIAPYQVGNAAFVTASVGGSDGGLPVNGADRFMHGITASGALYGVGRNTTYGTIGNNTTTDVVGGYVQVGTLTNWSKVLDGTFHVIALKTDGTIWTWGYNFYGQLGDGTTVDKSSPVQVGTLTTWANIGIGQYASYAIKTDGTLWSWGYGANGQLGDNTRVNKSSPVQIGTLTNWSKVCGGDQFAQAIKTDGTMWSWGDGANGYLGDGTSVSKSSPVQVGTLTNWSTIRGHSQRRGAASVKTDGTLWAWGSGTYGRLGDGSIDKSSPIQIGTLTNWSDAFAGTYNSYFLTTSNDLYSCGISVDSTTPANLYWVGDGMLVNRSSPVQIGAYQQYSAIWGSCAGGYVQATNGMNFAWGAYGGTGSSFAFTATNKSSPVQVGTQTDWSSPFIKTDGTLWAWGPNTNGMLGANIGGGISAMNGPIRVGTLTNWKTVSKGSSHTVALKTDGTIWAWGGNTSGQLGQGNTTDRSSPVQVGTLTTWTKIVAGLGWTFALRNDGTIWAWGLNSSGQLGQGNTTVRSSPVQIGTLTTWSDIGASNATGYAAKTDGTLWAWGLATSGQLGNGTSVNISSPVQVGTLTTWTAIPEPGANQNYNLGGAFSSSTSPT